MAIEPHASSSKLMDKLTELLDRVEDLNHEELEGLLGGNASGHYHLTNEELQKLAKLLLLLYPNGSETYPIVDHEKLSNLLGGASAGHYHLTSAQLTKLNNMPSTGAQGEKGDKGDKGDAGTAATITVGTVTTGAERLRA